MKHIFEYLFSKKSDLDKLKKPNKYHLDKSDSITVNGHTFYRIIADISFGNVSEGDKGGYIESINNLSQTGNCWVDDYAKVFGDAQVFGSAQVFGNAIVCDNVLIYDDALVYDDVIIQGYAKIYEKAQVYGKAQVWRDAQIYGDAQVYGEARVSGNAKIYGNAKVNYNINKGKITK